MPKTKSRSVKSKTKKYNNDICSNNMSFDDCEIAILRQAVDVAELKQGLRKVNNDDIKTILKIVEDFIQSEGLICYGGTAINNLLPKSAQFYKRDLEIPDYDFYSSDALNDAKKLANIYFEAGYIDVEAKSGVHYGTFKVFVNYIPIADITMMHKTIYDTLSKDAISISGIKYAPPNFLRMSMYLELSRPDGDVSRWEKVMKRLNLLNKQYPFDSNKNCKLIDFKKVSKTTSDKNLKLNGILRDIFIDNGLVFFGGYSTQLYSKYITCKKSKKSLLAIPDFDILSEDPCKSAIIAKESLLRLDYTNVTTVKHNAIGDLIPEHVELIVDGNSMAFIYKPVACHSYNEVEVEDKTINIATIDTILAFYLSFLYADMPYYDKDRLLCIAMFLFNIQCKNRFTQTGILKRFNIDCYGKQNTLEDMRSIKSDKFEEFKLDRLNPEYEMWFLNYKPNKMIELPNRNKNKTMKSNKSNSKLNKHTKTNKKPKSNVLSKLKNKLLNFKYFQT